MKTKYTYELPDNDHGHLGLRISVLQCNMLGHDNVLLLQFESQCPAVWLHGLLELRHKDKGAEHTLFSIIQNMTEVFGKSLTANTRIHAYIDETSQLVERNGQVVLENGPNSLLAFPMDPAFDSQEGFDKICKAVLEQTELSAPLITFLQAGLSRKPLLDESPGDPSTWWHAAHPLAKCLTPWPSDHPLRFVHVPEPSHRIELVYNGKHVGHMEPTSRDEFTIHVPSRSTKPIKANVFTSTTLRECFDDLFNRPEIL